MPPQLLAGAGKVAVHLDSAAAEIVVSALLEPPFDEDSAASQSYASICEVHALPVIRDQVYGCAYTYMHMYVYIYIYIYIYIL